MSTKILNEFNKVVVTGIGLITPGANNLNELWHRIINKDSYINRIPELEITHDLLRKEGYAVGAKFDALKLADFMQIQKIEEKQDITTKIALIAAEKAINNSQIGKLPSETAVIVGSARGNTNVLEKKILEVNNYLASKTSFYKAEHIRGASLTSASSIAAAISRHYGLEGMSRTIGTACTSSLNAIGDAYKQIKFGETKTALAGGAEATLNIPMYIWFNLAGIYTPAAENISSSIRPFCTTRLGTAIGEMSCMLLLEEEKQANKRNAHIYGEIISFADAIDSSPKSFETMSEDGIPYSKVIAKTLDSAQIKKEEINLIISHGTGTKTNDNIEIRAINNLWSGNKHPPTISTKGITGHGVGACAALETAIGLYAMQNQTIPPNSNIINTEIIVPNQNIPTTPSQQEINYILKIGSGFGGYLSSLLIKRK